MRNIETKMDKGDSDSDTGIRIVFETTTFVKVNQIMSFSVKNC
jgi:hypothetical protein